MSSVVTSGRLTIAGGNLRPDALAGQVVIVTGAGGGIGFEAARSLLWLGATVVVAEVDEKRISSAQRALTAEWPAERVMVARVDVSDETAVGHLIEAVEARFGQVDTVLNNATATVAGMSVVETPVAAWDRSYEVNLRGPALLARACLPGMIARKHGVFVCVSSTGGPYLAAYETLKAAQLQLANSLDAEMDGSGVVAFTIGPGLVPTQTATDAIAQLAPRLGTTVEEFWKTNWAAVLPVEAAGAGFAAAIAQAERYAGQEISSSQALVDAGIELPSVAAARPAAPAAQPSDLHLAVDACQRVVATLAGQAAGWKERSFFERQWMQRDFKQRVGMTSERCLELLGALEKELADGHFADAARLSTLDRLRAFYIHMGELARGYVKDPGRREEQLGIITGWSAEIDALLDAIGRQ